MLDDRSLLDPVKVDGIVVITHLFLRIFLTVAFTIAFFVVLGFILWKPNTYLVIVDVVLAPTTFLMAQFLFRSSRFESALNQRPRKHESRQGAETA